MSDKGSNNLKTKERKTRSDKKTHVNPALDHDSHEKLVQLAISCGMTKTNLAEKLINLCLNNPNIINYMQDVHNTNPNFRVIPTRLEDKIQYLYSRT